MPLKLSPDEFNLPRELELDLLVDAELPEAQRRRLLESLDEQPGEWRTVAMRFLQRQVEKQSVRELMAGGNIIPVDVIAPRAAGRIGSTRMLAIAAGLLIATTSALITVYAMQMTPAAPRPVAESGSNGGQFYTNIPAEAVASDRGIPMRVPLVAMPASQTTLFPPNNNDDSATALRSWVIQPDGEGHAVVIPVNTQKVRIY